MLTQAAIGGIAFAACIVPCIMFICGGIPIFPLDLSREWFFVTFLLVTIGCCSGIICLTVFLTYIYTSDDINKSLALIYWFIFLIIPCGCLLLFYGCILSQTDWKERDRIRQREKMYKEQSYIDRQINRELRQVRQRTYAQKRILLMGNNANTTQVLFDNLRMISYDLDELEHFKHILFKYIIKNLKSLIIITLNENKVYKNNSKLAQNDSFSQVLSIPTYGAFDVQKYKHVFKNIISVWNDENIQNTFKALQSINTGENTMNNSQFENDDKTYLITVHDENTAVNENNTVQTDFMQHFMQNIKSLDDIKLNDTDIEMLLEKDKIFKKEFYFGNDEFQWKYEGYDYLFQYFGKQNENKSDKWIDLCFEEYCSLNALIYVIDLSIFEYERSTFVHVIRHWLYELCADRYYVPSDVEMTIDKFIGNEKMINDIKKFSKIKRYTYEAFGPVLLFVNSDIFINSIETHGMNALYRFFPDHNFDQYLGTANDNNLYEQLLEEIKRLYFNDNDNKKRYIHMKTDLNDVKQIEKTFKDIFCVIIHHSLSSGGLI